MNLWRVLAFSIAGLSILSALVIAYWKFVVPWMDERAWQRRTIEANERNAKQVAEQRLRQANVKNGRTERVAPIERKTGR